MSCWSIKTKTTMSCQHHWTFSHDNHLNNQHLVIFCSDVVKNRFSIVINSQKGTYGQMDWVPVWPWWKLSWIVVIPYITGPGSASKIQFNPKIIIVSWLTKEQRQSWSCSKKLSGNLAQDKWLPVCPTEHLAGSACTEQATTTTNSVCCSDRCLNYNCTTVCCL